MQGLEIPTAQQWEACDELLGRVSRTFAINIRVLPGDLRRAALVAYLLCRILDTVEDAPNLPGEARARLLLQFVGLVEKRLASQADLAAWIERTARVEGREADLDLIRQAPVVARCLHALPNSLILPVLECCQTMGAGMARLCAKPRFDRGTPIADRDDLEDYCYVVAGTVGEMLCAIFSAYYPGLRGETSEALATRAVSFGLALQLTNITKDFVEDYGRGECFIPSDFFSPLGLTRDALQDASPALVRTLVAKMTREALPRLDDALEFTLRIPRRYWRLRLFCSWPLWMAAETLLHLLRDTDGLSQGRRVRMSRGEVKSVLLRTTLKAGSNGSLRRDFLRARGQLLRELKIATSEQPASAHRAAESAAS